VPIDRRGDVAVSVSFGARLAAPAVTMVLAVPAPAVAASHPRENIRPSPDYMTACVERGAMSDQCIAETVDAINHARAVEPMLRPTMILPTNFRSLSPARQAFVVLNLERVDRGLRPIVGMVRSLNRKAWVAAAVGVDPRLSNSRLRALGAHRYRSVYARDYGALASDYEWMYKDGYGSELPGETTNVNCPYAEAGGCWAHRDAILDPFKRPRRLVGGMAGVRAISGAQRITAILVGSGGRRPHFTYTWRQTLAHGADGHHRG
jgi:hypothetical protein